MSASHSATSRQHVAELRPVFSDARVGPTPPLIGGVPGGGGGAEPPLRRVAELRAPFWIAHRGMANVYAENTLEAYRRSVAPGVGAVESDCWRTRDAGLVCLHDGTSTAAPTAREAVTN